MISNTKAPNGLLEKSKMNVEQVGGVYVGSGVEPALVCVMD